MRTRRSVRGLVAMATMLVALAPISGGVSAQTPVPTWSKSFSPSTIGPGSVSTLRFQITNNTGAPVTLLAFTDDLSGIPVTIADPANAIDGCDGTLSAPAGGNLITYSGGELGNGKTCTIKVDVTSSTAGTHLNTTGDLTSTAGNSGTTEANLTVSAGLPGFSKSFSPTTVDLGERSTLTFLVDNTANGTAVASLNFTDTLPAGLVIADPANATTTCRDPLIAPATFEAEPGGRTITYNYFGTVSNPAVAANDDCTVTVDVKATASGVLVNSSGILSATVGNSPSAEVGKANADMTATTAALHIQKDFLDDPAPPGGQVTLQFTITNFDRDFGATGIEFTDDFPVGAGLSATGLPATDVCGAGSTLSATTLPDGVQLTKGTLGAGQSCTFSVVLDVATAAVDGAYVNETAAVTGTVNGDAVVGNTAAEAVHIVSAPLFTKSFTDDPVGPGGVVTLSFTLANTTPQTMTDIEFLDLLPPFITGSPSGPPGAGFCGAGSSATFFPGATPAFEVEGARLEPAGTPGDTCTFGLTLDVGLDAPSGAHENRTEQLQVDVGAQTITGGRAVDDLLVEGAPTLTKEFKPASTTPDSQVLLEFTLTHDEFASAPATAISFIDDLATMGAGFSATPPPTPNPPCGGGSSLIGGATTLTFTGGSLGAGESCTFSVPVNVASFASLGIRKNTTSTVTATVGGLPTETPSTQADLVVSPLVFTKEFTDDPVAPGGTATLEFTIQNTSNAAVDSIFFSDDLDAAVEGMAATLPPDPDPPCGPSSTMVGTTTVFFFNGELGAGESCTFSISVTVPSSTPDGTYVNATSNGNSSVGFFGRATDDLVVESPLGPLVTKEFVNDPVKPGGTVTLRFTVKNDNDDELLEAITFDDNLNATLTGLTASLPPNPDPPCGDGSAIVLSASDTFLTLDDGILPAMSQCTFDITLTVPARAGAGSYPNTTSAPEGNVGRFGTIQTAPATDTLEVSGLIPTFTKEFTDDPVLPGGQATLQFTIDSSASTDDGTDLSFSDDVASQLAGATATGLPQLNVCGAGSKLSGTGVIQLTGGNLLAGQTCSFSVTLDIPSGTPSATYINTTSRLRDQGLVVAPRASDELVVAAPDISVTKSDGQATAAPGDTLTYTIVVTNNTAVTVPDVDVADAFPPELTCTYTSVAAGGAAGNTATGVGDISDTLDMPAGSSVTYTADCAIDPSATGTVSNTVTADPPDPDETPEDNTATDETALVPKADLAISKSDAPDPVDAGETIVYTITVDNLGPSDASGVTVVDALPAGTTYVSDTDACSPGVPGPGSVTCDLGTIIAGGKSSFDITVSVDPATPAGVITNEALVSSGADDPNFANDMASEDTTVETSADLSVAKSDDPDPVANGGTLTYTIEVTNFGPSDAQDVVATDLLPPGVALVSTSGCAEDPAGVPACSLGTIAAGATAQYTITVDVDESAGPGVITNQVDVTSSTPDPVGPGSGEGNNNTAFEDTFVQVQAGRVDIEKATEGRDADTAPGPLLGVGTTVNWTYKVTNTGSVTLTDVTVSDDQGVAVSCPRATLGPAKSMTCTAAGTVVQGQYRNVGTVNAKSPDDRTVTDSDPSHYLGVIEAPAIDIEKSTNGADADGAPGPSLAVGSAVTWTYEVSNTGNADLTGVTVVDDQGLTVFCQGTAPPDGGGPVDDGQPFDLAVGESDTCQAFGTAEAGQYANVGTASGSPPSGPDVTDDDPSHYFGTVAGPAVIIEKSTNGENADDAPGPLIPVGDPVFWTYVVTNVGDAPLSKVVVTDDRGVAVTCPQDTLGVGESMTCTAEGVAEPGIYRNVGSVSALASGNRDVAASDPSHYLGLVDGAAIDLEKFTNGVDADEPPGPYFEPGRPITWTYVVANNGDQVLTDVTVRDDQGVTVFCQGTAPPEDGGAVDDGQPFTLGVGEADTCRAFGSAVSGQYANEGTATGSPPSGPDVTATDRSHYVSAPRSETTDLIVSKDGPGVAIAGEEYTWTVSVRNEGPATALGVVVTDVLPAGVTFVSTTGCAEDPNGVPTCSLGSIAPRTTKSFTVTVLVPADAAGETLTNVASADAATVDPDRRNNRSEAKAQVTGQADLEIRKGRSVGRVTAGKTFTYRITVANDGPSDAAGVTVVDTLPAGVSYVSDTDACVEGPAGTLTCSLGSLAAGASTMFEIKVHVDAAATGTIVNRAEVSASTDDPDETDNVATLSARVVQRADLAITKTDTPDPVRLGGALVYTITVTNAGPSDATGVEVVDQLPANTAYRSDSDACVEAPAGTLTCSLGTIPAGGSTTFVVRVRVTSDLATLRTNVAKVRSSTPDPDKSNNTAVASTRVTVPRPEVGLFDPGTARWTLLLRTGATRAFSYGDPSDFGLVGDWDGDGDRTVAVYRQIGNEMRLFARNANSTGAAAFTFPAGQPGDIPVAGDWNGDGSESLALFRPSTAQWIVFFDFADTVPDRTFVFGDPGDVPQSVDIDRDGDDDPVAYRDMGALGGRVFVRKSLTTGAADLSFTYGNPGDVVLFGDYDYDGDKTVGVWRPSDATFYLRNSNTSGIADITIPLGIGNEHPVAGFFL